MKVSKCNEKYKIKVPTPQASSNKNNDNNRLFKHEFVYSGGTLCCVLRQDTLLSQCLSPPRCTNGYQRIVGENLTICGGVTCDGLASRPGEVEILPAASCYRNRDKVRHQWALRPLRLRFFCFLFKAIGLLVGLYI